ncbi:MAG TPA: hypothetical protein VFR68_07225 [Candidatus Dormibacteraeota bacterium]|nr:hypothetical protein [Candidatus Dormibacteraeota bacterium]
MQLPAGASGIGCVDTLLQRGGERLEPLVGVGQIRRGGSKIVHHLGLWRPGRGVKHLQRLLDRWRIPTLGELDERQRPVDGVAVVIDRAGGRR